MTNLDSTKQPPSGHDADVLSEDRFIRLSKQISEELTAAQARLIALGAFRPSSAASGAMSSAKFLRPCKA